MTQRASSATLPTLAGYLSKERAAGSGDHLPSNRLDMLVTAAVTLSTEPVRLRGSPGLQRKLFEPHTADGDASLAGGTPGTSATSSKRSTQKPTGSGHACRRRFFLAHRARAARLAKARRSSSVILEKNAFAPAPAALSPPRRPRATAAGFFRLAIQPLKLSLWHLRQTRLPVPGSCAAPDARWPQSSLPSRRYQIPRSSGFWSVLAQAQAIALLMAGAMRAAMTPARRTVKNQLLHSGLNHLNWSAVRVASLHLQNDEVSVAWVPQARA